MLPLLGLLLTAWILVFIGSIVIFNVIVPIPQILPGRGGTVLTSVVKALLSIALVSIWLFIMIRLRDFYFKRKLLPARP